MGASLAVGVTLTVVVAAKILLPIAATALVGLASAGANATTSALYSGDSDTRLTVLTQIKQSFDTQPSQQFDPQTADWILPAIEQCLTDVDPNVVALADEMIVYININKSLTPLWRPFWTTLVTCLVLALISGSKRIAVACDSVRCPPLRCFLI
jgi:hypothetical protein